MRRLGTLLRAALSIALIAAIVWWAGAEDILALLTRASFLGLGAVILMHGADRILMAYKWWRLLRARGYQVHLTDAIRSYFLGSFVGAVIPVAGGADLARIASLRGKGASTESLISSVALERAIGAISHGFFCLAAVGLAVGLSIDLEISTPMLAAAAVATVVVLTLGLPLSFVLADTVAERPAGGSGMRGKLASLACDYAGWSHPRRELWILLTLTFVEGFYPILTYYLAARALGIETTVVQMPIAVPLAALIRLLSTTSPEKNLSLASPILRCSRITNTRTASATATSSTR